MNIPNFLNTSLTYFENEIFNSLTVQQKRVAIVASAALSVLALLFLGYRYCFQMKNKEVIQDKSKEQAFSDAIDSDEVAEDLKDSETLPSTIDEGHSFLYLKKEEIETVGMIKKETYQNAVVQLPICCVDTFLFNPADNTYLLVLRKDPPAKGTWWLPGGRLYKGESFFECSVRKCKEEVGLDVTAEKTLGFAATIFPDSMWNTQTHTVNFLVLAFVNQQTKPKINKTCDDYKWSPIDVVPEDPYVLKAYRQALKIINTPNIKV